ncbi:MAG: LysR substrate-binding domain-containing protein [Rhodocyclaceae bacterium]
MHPHRLTFDLDVLRSFVAGIELGSFARAADRLGRSTSAVSAQLKKLEDQIGLPVLRKSGRGLVPTDTGETLLVYARRLLALNDEAAVATRGAALEGVIRLGLQEDFGETLLTGVLGRFVRAHPKVRIEARVARNAELIECMAAGSLDLALVWQAGHAPAEALHLATLPMRWIGPRQPAALPPPSREAPLPLVVFDGPCLMRRAATDALDRAGIPWRIAFTSSSLAGLWAAVAAGLGLTVRTQAGLPPALQVLPGLPALPDIGLQLLHAGAGTSPARQRIMQLLQDAVAETLAAPAPDAPQP